MEEAELFSYPFRWIGFASAPRCQLHQLCKVAVIARRIETERVFRRDQCLPFAFERCPHTEAMSQSSLPSAPVNR